MVTLALKVAYKGAAFSGFARQPGQPTVQGELERALELLLRRPVNTTCSGRTDTGVHARGQVVSFELDSTEFDDLLVPVGTRSSVSAQPKTTNASDNVPASYPKELGGPDASDLRRFKRSMNALTHDDIAVKDAWRAADGFSARFDAMAREYRYFLAVDETPPVFMTEFSWHVGPLDVAAMERASRCLIGEQDFKSFCKAVSAVDKPTCRNVMEVSFSEEKLFGESMVVVKVVGSSFLHSMVRTIVGTLAQVGKGRRPESWVAEALEARDRTAAGECAPAWGLVFWEVRYE